MRRNPARLRLTLLAMASPRYAPAGLLVELGPWRVMIDGGAASSPQGRLDDWVVSDERADLMPEIRRLARPLGLDPRMRPFHRQGLIVDPRQVWLSGLSVRLTIQVNC